MDVAREAERKRSSQDVVEEERRRHKRYHQDLHLNSPPIVSNSSWNSPIVDDIEEGEIFKEGDHGGKLTQRDCGRVKCSVRHDREEKHGRRDREGEHSSSSGRHGRREDMHGSGDRERVRRRDKECDKRRVTDKDRDTYKDSSRSQHSEPGYHWVKRSGHYKNDNLKEEGEKKLKFCVRDDDDQGDYVEKVESKLVAEVEEDIDNILEKSRKIREAILEEYRRRQQEKQGDSHSEDSVEKDSLAYDKPTEQVSPAKVSANFAPEGFISRKDGLDEYNADSMSAAENSSSKNRPVIFQRAPGTVGVVVGTPQLLGVRLATESERLEDMFCDSIFGESPADVCKKGKGEGLQAETNGLNDNWDDAEGYYSYRFGEVLDGRYEVIAAHGKGVFSTVVRAKDLKDGRGVPKEAAIKIIRNNATMYKTGLEELVILKKLAGADPEDKCRCVRFISSFKYRNHLCLVFESLHMNLRAVLKKFGCNVGLNLTAVREYAKQIFIALKHLRNCGVLHCDIKPDNILVNEDKKVLKLCDFGNAMFAGKNEITPYLVSRFYRAPEIILGLPYDHPMDMWSVGCCLYELYSGKVLFPGPSNNDMLRLHMKLKGPFPKKMLRKGGFTAQHFDRDLKFLATEEDPVTKQTVKRLLHNIKPRDISSIITGSTLEDPKMVANFKDLLEKIFVLDPEKRITVAQALNHPFITGGQLCRRRRE